MSGEDVAAAVRQARQESGLKQTEVARAAGIAPSYLSRIESAAWNGGGPLPSDQVLRALARVLSLSSTELIRGRDRARRELGGDAAAAAAAFGGTRPYAVRTDEAAIYQAGRELVARNPRRGTVRATGTLLLHGAGSGAGRAEASLAAALGDSLAEHPGTTILRVCAATPESFGTMRAETARLAGSGREAAAATVRTRFCFGNPLAVDFLITEHEALIVVPRGRRQPRPAACLVVDDPDFVHALQDWYDEFVWDPACDWAEIDQRRLVEALDEVEARLAAAR